MTNHIKNIHIKDGSVFVALITPFKEDLSIDWQAFEKYVDWLCAMKVDGLVPCGTTGGFLTLTPQEHRDIIRRTVGVAQKRAAVLAGASAVTVRQTVSYVQAAQEEGATGVLLVTPYYVKPSQEGLYQYYYAVHQATQFPIVIYNNPGRTCVNIDVDTIIRLADLPFIIGLKDSTPDLSRPLELRQSIRKDQLQLFSGEDQTLLPFLAAGGDGAISVTAGIVPNLYKRLLDAWNNRNVAEAKTIADEIFPITQALFKATNPIPVKYACSVLGFGEPYTRLSVGSLSKEHKNDIDNILSNIYPNGLCHS